jgi:hypothetical protein
VEGPAVAFPWFYARTLPTVPIPDPPQQLSEIGHPRPGLNKSNASCVGMRVGKAAQSVANHCCVALVTGMH